MTDITELAQNLKAAADREMICRDVAETSEIWERTVTPENILALLEALEKAQAINAAAEKLVRCKGRYHSEQNYRALAALFGVKTPDLPPLEHENVHYVDAAEMEIEALRQRIAELESRTVKLPEPEQWDITQVLLCKKKVVAAMRAAGIKWEAE
ncbi:hypothetical protein A9L51_24095 [Klebsiella pneumoniae]|nr:ead/Ea22-like family protein [Klebsiella pneumoniae]ELA0402630.1 ead/Ea22-like family protein [Klebsiella pneumoniae]OBT33743.1 hypothetical protein A9L51_24095 [Klebsiella pneumoniae]